MSTRKEIIDSVARTAYVLAWANYKEEQGESAGMGGQDLMDLAPKTPVAAKKWAQKLARGIEKLNGAKIEKLYARVALSAAAAMHPGSSHATTLYRRREPTPDNFGYCMAMESLGTGVAWGDDHPDHNLRIPSSEFYCHSEHGCDGYVSERSF